VHHVNLLQYNPFSIEPHLLYTWFSREGLQWHSLLWIFTPVLEYLRLHKLIATSGLVVLKIVRITEHGKKVFRNSTLARY
jgi:hypothetical protein